MPTYQYECDACTYTFEVLQSITAKKLRKCPECGKLKLHRLIGTGSGIIFKGSGFYETDFKTKKEPKKSEVKEKPKKEKEDSSAKSKKTETVSDGEK